MAVLGVAGSRISITCNSFPSHCDRTAEEAVALAENEEEKLEPWPRAPQPGGTSCVGIAVGIVLKEGYRKIERLIVVVFQPRHPPPPPPRVD